jgi:hypothetical protein
MRISVVVAEASDGREVLSAARENGLILCADLAARLGG